MALKLANNAISNLSSSISASDTTISLTPGTGALFPALSAGQFTYATLVRASDSATEIVKVTARSVDALTVTRAQEGNSAKAFVAGDRIEQRLTAGGFEGEVGRVEAKADDAQADATQALADAAAAASAAAAAASLAASVDAAALKKSGGSMTGILKLAKGSDIASAATVDLSAATGNTVHITGTVAISAVILSSGQVMDVIFDGALTLTHHATNNNLPSGTNITTAAGDRARYFYDGVTTYCMQYQRADGTPIVGGTSFSSAAENAAGTIENKAVDPLGVREAFNATGSAPVYACRAWVNFNGSGTVTTRGSGNVSSVSDNGVGDYTINFATPMPDANYATICTCSSPGSATGVGVAPGQAAPTASALRIATVATGGAPALGDYTYVSVAVYR